MSPDLATLQADFTRAILAQDDAAAISAIDDDTVSATLRLAIYRNTVLSALCEALRLSYLITEKVVGSAFFEQAALAFARVHPPADPVLARYGAGFPVFLESLPSLKDLVYLPDLARLEWAVDQAGYSPTTQERRISLAVDGGVATVTLSASLRLLATATSVHALWQALDAGDEDALAGIDWNAGPEWLAIHRSADGIRISPLSEPAWRLAAALLAGDDIAMSDVPDANEAAVELLSAPFIRVALADPVGSKRIS